MVTCMITISLHLHFPVTTQHGLRLRLCFNRQRASAGSYALDPRVVDVGDARAPTVQVPSTARSATTEFFAGFLDGTALGACGTGKPSGDRGVNTFCATVVA